jgi:hypothetical protein
MKKVLFAAAFAAFALTSCGSDDDGGTTDCVTAASEVSISQQTYSGDPSTENCNEYRDALQIFINSGCAGAEQSSFEGLLELLPCN